MKNKIKYKIKDKIKNKVGFVIVEYFLAFILKLIGFTCKKTYNNCHLDDLNDEPCVLLFWHDRLAFMPFLYKISKKQAYVIISEHNDGELITKIISHFNIKAIRGSSKRGAVGAFVQALKVVKSKNYLVITPDGPRGPRHSISNGCITLPQKTGVKIVVADYSSSKSWFFNSWDKMELPKPFSEVVFKTSKPFSIENLDLQSAKDKIAQEFERIKSF